MNNKPTLTEENLPPAPPASPAPVRSARINTPIGPIVKLLDGAIMPMIGFGTDKVIGPKGSPEYEAIKVAVKVGYRHFDTAALYGSEETLGAALKECIDENLVSRSDLFIVTKVWNTHHKRESVMKSCLESLARLGMEYVDLFLVHWPMAFAEDGDSKCPVDENGKIRYLDVDIVETWQGMEDVKDSGLAKSIGLSNFNHKQIDRLWEVAKHKPVVNQVEGHPFLQQTKLLEYSYSRGMILVAHCCLGSPASCAPRESHVPTLLENEIINEVAETYAKTPAQICLKFLLQHGIAVIPKSINESRIKENFNLMGFQISDSDLGKIYTLDKGHRYCVTTAADKHRPYDHPEYPFHLEY